LTNPLQSFNLRRGKGEQSISCLTLQAARLSTAMSELYSTLHVA